MIFRISHQLRYLYSARVFLDPHILRLHPRHDASQEIRNYSMTVTPQPLGISDFLDAEGNIATCTWFEEMTDSLTISISFEARTSIDTPFDYLVTDSAFLQLPVRYEDNDTVALAPFLNPISLGREAEAYVKTIVLQAKGSTLDFLFLFNTALYENFSVEIRDHGSPWTPDVTFKKKSGACRDLAVLFIAACRSVGLAARFVSGYQEGDPDMSLRHLHAWIEVYIPGGGWRGYDPTHGLVVADRHVVLASSCHSMDAAPVTGTFRGTGITASMEYSIDLSPVPA